MAAFAIRNLSVLNYAQGFTMWHYRHAGTLKEVVARGFFNPAAGMIEPGDMIAISAADGGAMVFAGRVVMDKVVDAYLMTTTGIIDAMAEAV